jgi:hypothetical protein
MMDWHLGKKDAGGTHFVQCDYCSIYPILNE